MENARSVSTVPIKEIVSASVFPKSASPVVEKLVERSNNVLVHVPRTLAPVMN